MDDIDFLEFGGHLHVRIDDEDVRLADPRRLHFQQVLAAIEQQHVPDAPRLPAWKDRILFDRWCAAWNLPSNFDVARRLAYLVDHYRAAITSDLATAVGVDLGELWRERRWQFLIDLIDRLPSHSWYAATVATDEAHTKMLAEQIASQKASGETAESTGPHLTTWTPEVAMLTNVYDAIMRVAYNVVAVQAGKKAGAPPEPAPRPVTPLDRALKRAEYERRKSAHERLVARVLPHKKKD